MELKLNHKIFLIVLKAIPIVLSFMYFISFVLSCFKIKLMILTMVSYTSIFPLIFLYLASYAFQFCDYHRMFLHYISIISLFNIIDYYWMIPVNSFILLIMFLIITFIFLIITLYKYLKSKRHVDKNI